MRHTVQSRNNNNTYNNNSSPFNGIKRSSLVGSDDAVETFKCHAEYEPGAGFSGC